MLHTGQAIQFDDSIGLLFKISGLVMLQCLTFLTSHDVSFVTTFAC